MFESHASNLNHKSRSFCFSLVPFLHLPPCLSLITDGGDKKDEKGKNGTGVKNRNAFWYDRRVILTLC